MQLRYELVVVVPDEIDDTTKSDIDAGASDHDGTLEAKIRRYLGGLIEDAVSRISDELPEGWRVYIAETS